MRHGREHGLGTRKVKEVGIFRAADSGHGVKDQLQVRACGRPLGRNVQVSESPAEKPWQDEGVSVKRGSANEL